MPLRNLPVDQITETDLNRLVVNGVMEGRRLDYKEQLKVDTGDDKNNFLADIAAMANTLGGDILYGIEEQRDTNGKPTGIPQAVVGVDLPNWDPLRLQLQQLIRDGIAPRIQGIELGIVPLASGRSVIIIRIPPSIQAPHMITRRSSPFYARASGGNSPMDVDEIRQAFLRTANLIERADTFRRTRSQAVSSDSGPILVGSGAKTFLHIIPFTAQPFALDFSDGQVNAVVRDLPPLMPSNGVDTRLNFDGRVNVIPPDKDGEPSPSYVQVFRDGMIEYVDTHLAQRRSINGHMRPVFYSPDFETTLVNGLKKGLQLLHSLTIPLPILVFLTLTNVQGYVFAEGYQDAALYSGKPGRRVIDRADLYPAGQIIDRPDQEVEQVLKPIFDTVANASGLVRSPAYDDNGQWKVTS